MWLLSNLVNPTDTMESHKVFEKIISIEKLPIWTNRTDSVQNGRRLSDPQNCTAISSLIKLFRYKHVLPFMKKGKMIERVKPVP